MTLFAVAAPDVTMIHTGVRGWRHTGLASVSNTMGICRSSAVALWDVFAVTYATVSARSVPG